MIPSLNQVAQRVLASVDDRTFYQLQFLRRHGRLPNIVDPSTLNEKIQWLKLHYRNPQLKACADKYRARSYVSQRIGDRYLIPLIGVFSDPLQIDFESFPNSFVLKATHGSGWNIICGNSDELDRKRSIREMERWISSDFFKVGREWAYLGLEPRVICEAFIGDVSGQPPCDYKVFCFNGIPQFVQVDHGRYVRHTRSLYSTDWSRIHCGLEYPLAVKDTPRPAKLLEMLEVASVLSADFPLVRVDLYEVAEQVFFGELTFYPGKGVERFRPGNFDTLFGERLDLSKIPPEFLAA